MKMTRAERVAQQRAARPTIEVVIQSVGTVVEVDRARGHITIKLAGDGKVAAYECGHTVELEHDKTILLEALCQ